MDVEDKHIVHKYVNEQGEHEERKMSVNCLLNNSPQELVNIKTNGLHNSSNEISRLSDSKHDKPTYDDQYIEYVEGSPPTTPTVNATVPQRAPCSVCKSETGRCHASDPGTMQNFFASTLGFDGVLNVADWLCMKCYSKWYNRCKRKASSALNLSVVDASIPMPTKRKRREREKDGHVPKVESDKKDSDRDTDSDDALLLARIGGNYPTVPPSISSEENADLESASVEELRTEVVKLRKEMRQMVSDIANRDEQVEGMMSFVRNEVALMHSLLKDIHSSKWSNPILIPNPNPNPNCSSVSSSSSSSSSSSLSSSSSSIGAPSSTTNHLPSLTSLPSIPLSFSVPGLHS